MVNKAIVFDKNGDIIDFRSDMVLKVNVVR